MRGVPLTAMIAAGLCMAASAPIMTVNRNEAGTVTGSRYVTFFVLQGNSSGSTMVDRQLKADIETELTGKGCWRHRLRKRRPWWSSIRPPRRSTSRNAFYQPATVSQTDSVASWPCSISVRAALSMYDAYPSS